MFEHIKAEDPEVFQAITQEVERQRNKIELIASENFVTEAVLEAAGSPLTNKYAEGYPGKRYYGGCEYVDIVESLAIERAKKLFGAEHVNVQPHSGAQANTAVYFAILEPGDKILGMDLSHGGHLTHGMKLNVSGRTYQSEFYQVDPETQTLNYDKILEIAKEVIDPEDPEMLSDLIIAAYNQASEELERVNSEKLDKITGGVKLPF